jgi:hypothetical protein
LDRHQDHVNLHRDWRDEPGKLGEWIDVEHEIRSPQGLVIERLMLKLLEQWHSLHNSV